MTYPTQKAILINPKERTVTEVQMTAGGGDEAQQEQHMKDMYALLECTTFAVACTVDGSNDLFIDDEGIYVPKQAYFAFESEHMGEMPLGGKSLVMGFDASTGSSIETTLTVEQIAAKVRWLSDGSVEY